MIDSYVIEKAIAGASLLKTGELALVDQLSSKGSHMKCLKVGRTCLLGLCLASVFGLATASVSAAPLLFALHGGLYPYHLVGTAGESTLWVGGFPEVTAQSADILALILSPTLFDLKVEFLHVKETLFGGKCKNGGKVEAVVVNLLGHFGFAKPVNRPAVLMLVPAGFEFECLGGFAKVKVRGSVIGEIVSPGLNVAAELMRIVFKPNAAGKQEFTIFELGNAVLTEQFLETSFNGGEFEESALDSDADLSALPGTGKFLLVSP